MAALTEAGRRMVADIAARHGVSAGAAEAVLQAMVAGQGRQAQFSHPDLGGPGQWSAGGMLMIGDMFNDALKARVAGLCADLSALVLEAGAGGAVQSQSQSQSGGAAGVSLFVPGASGGANWWPAELGQPASVGAQNDLRYAVFPAARRLAIDIAGKVTVYDIGDHVIAGFAQQQGGGQSLSFTSQRGLVRVADLPVVSGGAEARASASRDAAAAPARAAPPEPETAAAKPTVQAGGAGGSEPAASPAPAEVERGVEGGGEDVFALLERVADLHARGILTQDEFEAKKADLLARI